MIIEKERMVRTLCGNAFNKEMLLCLLRTAASKKRGKYAMLCTGVKCETCPLSGTSECVTMFTHKEWLDIVRAVYNVH